MKTNLNKAVRSVFLTLKTILRPNHISLHTPTKKVSSLYFRHKFTCRRCSSSLSEIVRRCEKSAERGQILRDLQRQYPDIDQKTREIWSVQAILQPTIPVSDRLLGWNASQNTHFMLRKGQIDILLLQ